MPIQQDLIFDLGMYEGQDTAFYLNKGFRVVALEAHPEYAVAATKSFANEIARGRLVVIHRALWMRADETIAFHTRGAQSSIFKEAADSGGPSKPYSVQTTTLNELIASHGLPRYLKCDLEGADRIMIEQLSLETEKPVFLSVETDDPAAIGPLTKLGFDRFQIVNQQYHARTKIPKPAREGQYAVAKMDVESSGLFGRELNSAFWMPDYEAVNALQTRARLVHPDCNRLIRYMYRRWGRLTGKRWLIPTGWTDLHACRREALV